MKDADTIKKISLILRELGISPAMSGYKYLNEAILMAIQEDISSSIINRIYKPIAKNNGVSWSTVERCIRHAVESSIVSFEEQCRILKINPTAGKNGTMPVASLFHTIIDNIKLGI